MKIENFKPTSKFFMLSNGDLVFIPAGLRRRDYVVDEEQNVKVRAFEVGDDGIIKNNALIDIVFACTSIVTAEEKEKIFFINHRHKINYFYRNLLKVDHGYKDEDMYEHVQELINTNRIRIVRRWKISESEELQQAYSNIFNI